MLLWQAIDRISVEEASTKSQRDATALLNNHSLKKEWKRENSETIKTKCTNVVKKWTERKKPITFTCSIRLMNPSW